MKKIKRVAIAIDKWKLSIFEKHLDKAGFVFKKRKGVTNDTLLLMVETDAPMKLHEVVKTANTAAAKVKKYH